MYLGHCLHLPREVAGNLWQGRTFQVNPFTATGRIYASQNDHPGGQGRIYTSNLNFVSVRLSKPGPPLVTPKEESSFTSAHPVSDTTAVDALPGSPEGSSSRKLRNESSEAIQPLLVTGKQASLRHQRHHIIRAECLPKQTRTRNLAGNRRGAVQVS